MDLATTAELELLTEPVEQGPAVSLMMPTARAVTDPAPRRAEHP